MFRYYDILKNLDAEKTNNFDVYIIFYEVFAITVINDVSCLEQNNINDYCSNSEHE